MDPLFGKIADQLLPLLNGSMVSAGALTLLLLFKSIKDFSYTGPAMRQEILRHYRMYIARSLLRLAGWCFAILTATGLLGGTLYALLAIHFPLPVRIPYFAAAAFAAQMTIVLYLFLHPLLYRPAVIAASSHYSMKRLYGLWRRLSPGRIRLIGGIVLAVFFLVPPLILVHSILTVGWSAPYPLMLPWLLVTALAGATLWPERTAGVSADKTPSENMPPNIIMIGSDTLRADRLGCLGNKRDLTPFIDRLARKGVLLSQCHVPCARTAPSLLSLFTGTWPKTHGIRDNFVGDDDTRVRLPTLAAELRKAGWQTAALGDWAASDLRKFDFGFDRLHTPPDQWNIKYLIRQGPKDIRLLLSLFIHNRLGRWLLPEIYYLGGTPLTHTLGKRARTLISELARNEQPFFLNIFLATTHPPFGSEFPYYVRYADPDYQGDSKFVMAHLTDPFEIIRRQGEPATEFDLEQILNLYDGCVRNFDDEVRKIYEHLKDIGILNNTLLVIYSDHGMEFFENDTWGQGNSVLSEHSSRVPVVFHWPQGGLADCATITGVTRSIDIAPTILDLVGRHPPASMEGTSLRPVLLGKSDLPELCAYTETGIWLTRIPGMNENHLHYPDLPEILEVPDKSTGTLAIKPDYRSIVVDAKDRAIRTDHWKLVRTPCRNGPIYTLYDLISDPDCRLDVSDKYPETFVSLKNKLDAFLD